MCSRSKKINDTRNDKNNDECALKMYKKGIKSGHEASIMETIQNARSNHILWVPFYEGTTQDGSILLRPVLFRFEYKHWALDMLTTAIIKLVETLQVTHTKLGLLHTDIRPANVMQNEMFGALYLVDWGFAQRIPKDNNNIPISVPILIPIPGNHTFMSISVLQQCLEHSFNGTLKYGAGDDLCSLIQVALCSINSGLEKAIYSAKNDGTLLKYWETVAEQHKELFEIAKSGCHAALIAELNKKTWYKLIDYKLGTL